LLTLNNVATSDGYTDALTLGPVPTTEKIVYLVANAAAVVQVIPKGATIGAWSDEMLISPQAAEFTRVEAIRFRSAVPGAPARVIAQLIEPRDPVPVGGQPFTSNLSPTGNVTPSSGMTGAHVYSNINQSINNGANTLWNANTVLFDTGGYWSAAHPSRLVPQEGGLFVVSANILWASNAVGFRQMQFWTDGGANIVADKSVLPVSGAATPMELTTILALAAGQIIELFVAQNSGAPLLIAPENTIGFAIARFA
jgi:hypothetical protein